MFNHLSANTSTRAFLNFYQSNELKTPTDERHQFSTRPPVLTNILWNLRQVILSTSLSRRLVSAMNSDKAKGFLKATVDKEARWESLWTRRPSLYRRRDDWGHRSDEADLRHPHRTL